MISGNMERLLQEIYSDTRVSPAEIIELRKAADEAAEKVLAEEGREGVLDALCKSFDVTNQLVQETALKLQKGTYSDLGKAMVLSLIEAHIALLKATINALK
jgi:hypothetical protein